MFGLSIFNIISATLDPPEGLSRYDVPRAGLSFLGNHAAQFRNFFFKHHEKIFGFLQKMMTHKNSDLKKAGARGFEAFLKQISLVLKDEARPLTDDEKSTFWVWLLSNTFIPSTSTSPPFQQFFMKEFSSTLNKPEPMLREVRFFPIPLFFPSHSSTNNHPSL